MPTAFAGAVNVIVAASTITTPVADAAPTSTVAPLRKFAPVTVTVTPPGARSKLGVTDLMVAATVHAPARRGRRRGGIVGGGMVSERQRVTASDSGS